MEDLLSLDDDVLNSVFEFHLPPVRRLPSILWARIRADISEYIVDREADGSTVMAWYHRQFIDDAKRYFLRIDKDTTFGPQLQQIAQNMYHYFMGDWSNGKRKPFQYTPQQIKKYKITIQESEENRYEVKS